MAMSRRNGVQTGLVFAFCCLREDCGTIAIVYLSGLSGISSEWSLYLFSHLLVFPFFSAAHLAAFHGCKCLTCQVTSPFCDGRSGPTLLRGVEFERHGPV